MIINHPISKVEYGDFQTPLELADLVCQQLIKLGVKPDLIIEPTCGIGHFIEISSRLFPSVKKIIGVEINPQYIENIITRKFIKDERIDIKQADFFQFDWSSLINQLEGNILVLGNFPWVTNSQQGKIGSKNLPNKNNFQHHNGLDAITGKSNFDISEWMLIQVIELLQGREGYLAMLCKTSVSRKLLSYFHSQQLNLAYCATYKINAKKYFGANVEACLLFCQFNSHSKNYFCDVFNSWDKSKYNRIGYRNNILIRDVALTG